MRATLDQDEAGPRLAGQSANTLDTPIEEEPLKVNGSIAGTDAAGRLVAPRTGQVLRITWGLFFVGSSAVNLMVTLPHPEFYRSFAELTFFAWYRSLLLDVAVPNATAITLLVVVLEFAAGLLILSRGTAVRVGLAGTALWTVFLMPSMGWYTVWSPLLLVVPLSLLRFRYPAGVVGLLLGYTARTRRGV